MLSELVTPQVEIVVREYGSDVVVVGLFERNGGEHDVVVGYPSREILLQVAELLKEVAAAIVSEDWVSVSRGSLFNAADDDRPLEEDIPF